MRLLSEIDEHDQALDRGIVPGLLLVEREVLGRIEQGTVGFAHQHHAKLLLLHVHDKRAVTDLGNPLRLELFAIMSRGSRNGDSKYWRSTRTSSSSKMDKSSSTHQRRVSRHTDSQAGACASGRYGPRRPRPGGRILFQGPRRLHIEAGEVIARPRRAGTAASNLAAPSASSVRIVDAIGRRQAPKALGHMCPHVVHVAHRRDLVTRQPPQPHQGRAEQEVG